MSDLTNTALPRRSFLRGHFLNALKTEQVRQQGHNAIRPPWVDLANFYEKCTACEKCITACEMQIIVKGAGNYPEVNFLVGKGECSFCQACVNVCESDVFRAREEVAWQHYVAIAENCLAQNGVECRSCEDSCEQRAIVFKRQIGKVAIPEVRVENCTGCGACLAGCPTSAIKIQYETRKEDER